MNSQSMKELISAILVGAGYKPLTMPLKIAGISFELDAAFLGANPSPDLILLVEASSYKPHKIRQIIEGTARALDVAGSKRPLTTIILGRKPHEDTVGSISQVSRLLFVDQQDQVSVEEYLRDRLAVLLPLSLPEPHESLTNPMQEIETRLSDLNNSVKGLVTYSKRGSEAVSNRFRDLLTAALSSEENENDES